LEKNECGIWREYPGLLAADGAVWSQGITEKVIWYVVKEFASKPSSRSLAPHTLGRTRARPCDVAGGELEQIQFLLGHVSVQTTERYLGCKQKLRIAVNGPTDSQIVPRRCADSQSEPLRNRSGTACARILRREPARRLSALFNTKISLRSGGSDRLTFIVVIT
jgi:hypothetical protein